MAGNQRQRHQVLQSIPESDFAYEKPLELDKATNDELRKDLALRQTLKETLTNPDFECKPPTEGKKKSRRWHTNRITGSEDAEVFGDITDPKTWWYVVLVKFPPRLGDPVKVAEWCARIKPGVEVSESIPYGVLSKTLESIQQVRVNSNFNALEVKESIILPELEVIEAIRIYGSSQEGFGTFPTQISYQLQLCGLVWYATKSRIIPEFWKTYFQRLQKGEIMAKKKSTASSKKAWGKNLECQKPAVAEPVVNETEDSGNAEQITEALEPTTNAKDLELATESLKNSTDDGSKYQQAGLAEMPLGDTRSTETTEVNRVGLEPLPDGRKRLARLRGPKKNGKSGFPQPQTENALELQRFFQKESTDKSGTFWANADDESPTEGPPSKKAKILEEGSDLFTKEGTALFEMPTTPEARAARKARLEAKWGVAYQSEAPKKINHTERGTLSIDQSAEKPAKDIERPAENTEVITIDEDEDSSDFDDGKSRLVFVSKEEDDVPTVYGRISEIAVKNEMRLNALENSVSEIMAGHDRLLEQREVVQANFSMLKDSGKETQKMVEGISARMEDAAKLADDISELKGSANETRKMFESAFHKLDHSSDLKELGEYVKNITTEMAGWLWEKMEASKNDSATRLTEVLAGFEERMTQKFDSALEALGELDKRVGKRPVKKLGDLQSVVDKRLDKLETQMAAAREAAPKSRPAKAKKGQAAKAPRGTTEDVPDFLTDE